MISPTIDGLNREIDQLHSRASEMRSRIPSDVEEYRRKLTEQVDELDNEIRQFEQTRDRLREAEEAVDKLPVRDQ